MASKQTRRSISVRGTTYEALRVHCDTNGRSMSDVVEELLAQVLGDTTKKAPAPKPILAPRPAREPRTLASKVARAPKSEAQIPRTPIPQRPTAATANSAGRPAPTPAHTIIARRPTGSFGSF